MHPLFNQELARQHREELERSTAQYNTQEDRVGFKPHPDFFPIPHGKIKTLYGRRVMQQRLKSKEDYYSANFIRRLILAIVFLCILMPLFGLIIGVSQGILIGVSLLCLVVIVLSLVLRIV